MRNLRNCWTRTCVLLPGLLGVALAMPAAAPAQAMAAPQSSFQITPFTYSALITPAAAPASFVSSSYAALYLHPVRTYLSGNRMVRSLGHSAETNVVRLWNLRLDFNRHWNPDPQSPAALSAAAVPGLPSNVGMQ